MGTPEKKSQPTLAKINKKLGYRTLALVIVVGSMIYGLEWYLKVRSDMKGLIQSDTVGWISAIQYLPDGQQAVLIGPDGKVHPNSGYKKGGIDRGLTWSPHGNFLYFVSDRNDRTFNLYRWSPTTIDDAPEQRTIGTRSRDNLRFPAQVTDDADSIAKGLIVTGGMVQEFDPSNQSTEQILPPTTREISQSGNAEEGGTEGQFAGAYGSLGTSFRVAAWCGAQKYIAAVMRRDQGEILIIQEMNLVDGKFPPPRAIMAGDKVDIAVNPKDGNVVFTCQGFQWTDKAPMDASGKPIKKPFVNGIGFFDVAKHTTNIITGGPATIIFDTPAISADGTQMALVVESNNNGDVKPQGLFTVPLSKQPGYKTIRVPGDIHEPSWSADGSHILAAIRSPGGKRSIVEIPTDQSPPRNITGDAGDFGFPMYSPQRKTAGN